VRSSRGAPIVVVAGLAGCGKTGLLRALADAGEQVLDLEDLASHRGSAFGGIGLPPQPSHGEFVRRVREALEQADPARALWVEDEGPFIGSVGVPADLQRAIASAPVVIRRASFSQRVARLVATYGRASSSDLRAAIERTAPRLGEARAETAAAGVDRGDLEAAVRVVLPYFDDAYRHRSASYRRRVIGDCASAV
jgi:tRNA 2-selenouridine synthase